MHPPGRPWRPARARACVRVRAHVRVYRCESECERVKANVCVSADLLGEAKWAAGGDRGASSGEVTERTVASSSGSVDTPRLCAANII